jgi:hypothetical protein
MKSVSYADLLLARVGQIVAPEHSLFDRYFLGVDSDLREAGVTLAVYDDMGAFADVCAQAGKFVPNAFRTDMVSFERGDALWLAAYDADGVMMATSAIRRYLLPIKTLGDWLATGALFYPDPITTMPEGERFYLNEEADAYASTIRGSFTYLGGLWINPLFRGKTNFAEALLTISSCLAVSKWDSAPMVSIAEDEVLSKNGKKYRFDVSCPGVYWHRPHKPERTKMWLVARTRSAIIQDAQRYCDADTETRIQVPQRQARQHEPAAAAG